MTGRVLKILGGVFAVFAVLLVTAVVVLMLIDWDRLRPLIADQSEERFGRRLEIQGPLDVRIGLAPRIVAEDVHLANAPWSREPFMFEAERAHLEFRLIPLIFGRIDIVDAGIDTGRLALEQNEAGEGNWDFLPTPEPTKDPTWPRIERLAVKDLSLVYDDHRQEGRIGGRVERLELVTPDETSPLVLTGAGNLEDLLFSVEGEFGSTTMMNDRDNGFPVRLDLTLGNQSVRLSGHTAPALGTFGSRFDLVAEGRNLHADLESLGWELDPLPPYEFSGRFEIAPGRYNVEDLRATLGFTQMIGNGTLEPNPPTITAEVRIPRLHLEDFAAFRDPDVELLHWPLPLEALRRVNLAIDAALERLTNGTLIEELLYRAHASSELTDGVLSIAPLVLDLAYGHVEAYATLDATVDIPLLDVKLDISGIRLEDIIEEVDPPEHVEGWIATEAARLTEQIAGTVAGSAELSARGQTPQEWLESLTGTFAVVMERGSMSYVIDRLIALDLAGLVRWMIGDEAIEIDCMITIMDIENGVASPRVMLLASEDTNIWGEGRVDLRTGTIELQLEALPRTPGVGVLRSPLIIEGDLTSPDIRPAAGPLVARGAVAAALGAVAAPIAALLGTITTGPGEEAVCANYLAKIEEVQEGEVPE